MQQILKKKHEQYVEKEGTYNKMENEDDKANQSRVEECDLRLMIEKYGVLPFEVLNQAKENLYLDMRGDSMTLNEKIMERQKVDDYFEALPALVRKNYNDSKEEFYQTIMSGDLEKLALDGVFSYDQTEELKKIRNHRQNEITNLQAQIEQMKGQLNEYQSQISNQTNNSNNDVHTNSI